MGLFFAIMTRACAVSRKKEQILGHFMRLGRVLVRCHEKRSKYSGPLRLPTCPVNSTFPGIRS